MSRAFQEQSRTNKAARQKQPYNHSSGSKSIKCWNSNPSLPQRVVSHSLRMKYAIRCWVDDQATQKALVGDPSQRPAER
uniref:NBS-LRR type resistance protein n=1 Tax=Cucumis melo TaxID=3656 RepID=A0A9I9E5H2_CUCME